MKGKVREVCNSGFVRRVYIQDLKTRISTGDRGAGAKSQNSAKSIVLSYLKSSELRRGRRTPHCYAISERAHEQEIEDVDQA